MTGEGKTDATGSRPAPQGGGAEWQPISYSLFILYSALGWSVSHNLCPPRYESGIVGDDCFADS